MSFKEEIINVAPIKNEQSMNTAEKKNNCMCTSLKLFFIISKYAGLLPIKSYNQEEHKNKCSFKKSELGIVITAIYLILFVPYVFFMYGKRLICGPSSSTLNNLEWHVMTFGYIIVDVESMTSLFIGAITIKNVCDMFEEMSMENSRSDFIKYSKFINIAVSVMIISLLLLLSSYIYVAWIRSNLSFGNYECTLVDQPFAVIIRGLTLIFPSINTLIILVLSTIIVNKFTMVSEDLPNALQKFILTESSTDVEKIAKMYENISSLVSKVNKYFGLQLLFGLASSLYTTIYYLYRFSTAANYSKYTVSSSHEKVHYLLGTIFRSSKIAILIVMGYNIFNSSNKPKGILRRSLILSSPKYFQEKIQLLLFIWQDQKITLSSLGVVNIGPWLIGPIVGNVITYLLVALQFKNSEIENHENKTEYMEFLF